MRWAVVRAVVVKEATEVRRDMRALVLLALLPALIYPSLLFVGAKAGAAGVRSLDAERIVVVRERGLPDDVEAAIQKIENADVSFLDGEASSPPAMVIRRTKENGDGPHGVVEVEVNRASEQSIAAERRVIPILENARRAARDGRLREAGISDALIAIPDVTVIDVAPPEKKSGFLLARGVVPILVLVILLGAYYPAIESTVGERERRTLRTLLSAPVDATSIALGKLVVVSGLALVAGMANILGLVITARIGLFDSVGFVIPARALIAVVVLFIPLAIVLAAVLMATASLARNNREAQTLLTPLTLVVTFPAMAPSFPGIEATFEKALIPIFGTALVVREVLSGNLDAMLLVGGVVGAFATALVAVFVAGRAFSVEALVSGRVALPLKNDGPLPLFDTILMVPTLVAVMMLAGAFAANLDPVHTVVIVQVATFLLVPLAFVALRSRRPLRTLGLVAPRRGTALMVVGALLTLPSLGVASARLARALLQPEELVGFETIAERFATLPVPVLILVLAVLPAVVEEITFRGVIQRAFGVSISWHAVWVTALLFAAFHGSLARVFPTAVVGALAGSIAYLARSTWPAMVVHVSHNSFALLVAVWLAGDGVVDTTIDPYLSIPSAIHLLVVPGVALLAVGRKHALAHSVGVPTDNASADV